MAGGKLTCSAIPYGRIGVQALNVGAVRASVNKRPSAECVRAVIEDSNVVWFKVVNETWALPDPLNATAGMPSTAPSQAEPL